MLHLLLFLYRGRHCCECLPPCNEGRAQGTCFCIGEGIVVNVFHLVMRVELKVQGGRH
jgi:hypothetical protein